MRKFCWEQAVLARQLAKQPMQLPLQRLTPEQMQVVQMQVQNMSNAPNMVRLCITHDLQ